MTWKKLASISVIIFRQAIYEYLLAGYCTLTQPLFSCLDQNAHANPMGSIYIYTYIFILIFIYIYLWYTYVYHKYQPYGSYFVWSWHANMPHKLRSLRPMATRLVSSPSPLVAFSFVAWDDIPVVGCNVWWFFPMFGGETSHVSSLTLQGKKEIAWNYRHGHIMRVSISVFAMVPSLFRWTSSGTEVFSAPLGCTWC